MTSFPRGSFLALSAGLLLAACASSARADEHPRLSPSRDAIVTYRLAAAKGQSQPQDVKVYFSGSGGLLRIDASDGRGVTILDRPDQRVTLIMLPQKIYTQFSPRQGLRNPFLLDLSMHYTSAGEGRVSGLACHKWLIDTPHGKATACVTDDGLILAENGVDADGVEGSLQAETVSYQDIPASTFQPPDGFERVQPHHHIRAGEPAGGGAPSSSPPDSLPGVPPARGSQDMTEPNISSDSTSDGSVNLPDQPPSGPSQQAPQK